MKIHLSRQHLEDIINYFIPFMRKAIEARIKTNRGNELEIIDKIALSVLKDIDLMLQRKKLSEQHKFSIKLKEAEALVFVKLLLNFPIPAEHFWRVNLRNQIVEQLDKQLI